MLNERPFITIEYPIPLFVNIENINDKENIKHILLYYYD